MKNQKALLLIYLLLVVSFCSFSLNTPSHEQKFLDNRGTIYYCNKVVNLNTGSTEVAPVSITVLKDKIVVKQAETYTFKIENAVLQKDRAMSIYQVSIQDNIGEIRIGKFEEQEIIVLKIGGDVLSFFVHSSEVIK